MQNLRGENKIAVLLTSLPPAAAQSVLAHVGPKHGDRLRDLMQRVRAEATPEITHRVVREFEEALRQATRGGLGRLPRIAAGTSESAESHAIDQLHEQSVSHQPSHAARSLDGPNESPPNNDPIAELRLIESERLAVALEGEHPRGVATVLSCLDAGKACEALKRLPPEVRNEVFPRIGPKAGGVDAVALRIVRAVVAKIRATSDQPAPPSDEARAQMMADMLKSMERADRLDLIKVLEEQDAALAAAVRERLYVFEDLLVIADRSLQKLLAEIDSKTLALALKGAAENIADKVMGNLSKRARETLTEEIGFLGETPAAEVRNAQKAVVEVIQRLDQSGELVMTR